MQKTWENFKANIPLRRTVVLAIIIFTLYLVRSMMNTILLTFIFTYLIVNLIKRLKKYIPKVPSQVIVIATYIILIGLIYLMINVYIPIIVPQTTKMVHSVVKFYQNNDFDWFMKSVHRYISNAELAAQAKKGMGIIFHAVTGFGTLTVSIVMSLLLSFFYTINLKELNTFSGAFVKTGYLKWFFEDVTYFGKTFVNTFGVVLEAQFLIAICNTVITIIGLLILKIPQIFALGIIVFVLSLIPVAGVIISLIPLGIVAYTVGGIKDVIYIIIMILIIHALESYVLNPKLMASKTELPIFYTFVCLLVGEHFLGIWGLIVAVPIFTFLLDILGIKPVKTKKQIHLKKKGKIFE